MVNIDYDSNETVEMPLVVNIWFPSQFKGTGALLEYNAAVEPIQYRRSPRNTSLATIQSYLSWQYRISSGGTKKNRFVQYQYTHWINHTTPSMADVYPSPKKTRRLFHADSPFALKI